MIGLTNAQAAEVLREAMACQCDCGTPTAQRTLNEALKLAIKALEDITDCRNELCLYCKCYEKKHLGACDGCRWRETDVRS